MIQDLQASLTGGGEINLGLIPMRKGDSGDLFDIKFVTSFMRLFRLSAFDQKAMQQVLIEYARLTPEQSQFNPRATLERELGIALQNAEQIEELETSAEDLTKAENTYDQLTREGTWLATAYGVIMRRRNQVVEEVRASTKPFEEKALLINTELISILSRKKTVEDNQEKARRALGLAQAQIDLVDKNEEALKESGYVHDLALQIKNNLKLEIASLQKRVGLAEARPVAELEEQLEKQSRSLEKLETERERFSALLITHLRGQLKDTEIAAAFSLLDSSLLRRIEGEDVTVGDLPELASRLRGIAAQINEKKDYRDDTVRVRLDFRNAEKTLREVGSIEELDRVIITQIEAVKTAERNLKEAQEIEALRTQIVKLENELEPIQSQITRYNDLQILIQKLPAQREAVATATSDLAKADFALAGISSEESAKVAEKRTNDSEIEKKAGELETLKRLLIELPQVIQLDDSGPTVEIPEAVSLFNLVVDYRTRHGTQEQLFQVWAPLSRNLESRLGERYTGAGATPAKRLGKLRAQLELVPKAREKAENEIHALLAATAGFFSHLRAGLHEVKRAADKINDEFRKVKLSNIEEVSCSVEEITEALQEIDQIIDLDPGLPLFGNGNRVKDLIQRVRTRWETHPIYHVEELFRVRLIIKNPGAKAVAYDQFNERAGSNGQVITLKVLVNLLVLSIQLHPQRTARIPFYIDEVASLDPVNFRSVQQFASEHGFNALYAAPEVKTGMSRYYPLRSKGGRLIVDDSCAQDASWHAFAPSRNGAPATDQTNNKTEHR